jgi:hypothetical protein
MAFALILAQRLGRTLEELKRTMTSEEFALHMELEIVRNSPPAPTGDAELQALFGGGD